MLILKVFTLLQIPLESLEEYDFDCNFSEVNVMITKSLIKSTSKVAGGCKSINVVSNGFLLINEEIVEPLVEISFDLYERKRRGAKNEVNDDDDREDELECKLECKLDNYCENEDLWGSESNSTSNEIFGKVVKKPYLHYLITSRIDYKVHHVNPSFQYKSIVVRNPTNFKRQYGLESRIFVAENGTILFCGCHHYPKFDSIIQPFNGVFGNYDEDDKDCERFDYELPNKIFKYLFKFIGQIINKGRE